MKVLCFGYRDWALKIYENIEKLNLYDVRIIYDYTEIDLEFISTYNPDFILFYGWSWKIEEKILVKYKCLMLHPSNLPYYRGGSPLQNQIMDGLKLSTLTIFRMTDKMDAGPIVKQSELNLEGKIREIFDRLTIIGTTLTAELLEHYPEEIMQEDKKATYYKRRTPKMSEITVDEIKSLSAEQLYNKIRCLTEPYPNAYILCGDGKKLFIKDASIKS